MFRPVRWRAMEPGVFQIQPGAAFNKKPHHLKMTRKGCLVQRRRMRMRFLRVVTVWLLACVQQRANDAAVAKLRRQGKRQPALNRSRRSQQSVERRCVPQGRRNGQAHLGSVPEERVHGFEFTVRGSRQQSEIRVGPKVAKHCDQLNLNPALARYTPRRYQGQRPVPRGQLWPRIQNRPRHLDDIRRQPAMPYRVLGHELQQGRRSKSSQRRRTTHAAAPTPASPAAGSAGHPHLRDRADRPPRETPHPRSAHDAQAELPQPQRTSSLSIMQRCRLERIIDIPARIRPRT